MNSSGMPPAQLGEIGGGMKAFVLLVFLFLTFLLIASSNLTNVDLTPDTPAVSANSAPVVVDSGAAADPDVITIQDGAVITQDSALPQVPVTGATCTNPYTVQSGDMLSGIAVLCNTTIAEIRAANPDIRNANLIYPGQQIRIPSAGAQAAPLPDTGDSSGQVVEPPQPQVVTTPATPALGEAEEPAPAPLVPATGNMIQPGTGVQVTGIDFPSNTAVYIAIGPRDQGYTIVATGVTGADGRVVTNIILPTAPDPSVPWVVVVATTEAPIIQAASEPFYIGEQ